MSVRYIESGHLYADLLLSASGHIDLGAERGKECEMSKGSKTTPRGRDADSGQFTTVKEAKDHPKTHVVERVPKPGYGDTKQK